MNKNRYISFGFLLIAIVSMMTGLASANPCDPNAPDFNPNYDPNNCDTMQLYDVTGTQALGNGFNINLMPNGPSFPLTVRIGFSTGMIGNPQSFSPSVVVLSDPTGQASDTDIQFIANEITCDPPSPCGNAPNFPMFWYQSFGAGQTEDLHLEISSTGPIGARYSITLYNDAFGTPISFEAANLDATNIPEFPTVAVPIATALGLLFFFQRRKGK